MVASHQQTSVAPTFAAEVNGLSKQQLALVHLHDFDATRSFAQLLPHDVLQIARIASLNQVLTAPLLP